MKLLLKFALTVFGVLALGIPSHADVPAASSLLTNGDFEADTDGDGILDGWTVGKVKSVTREVEGAKHFVRLSVLNENDLVEISQTVRVPDQVKGLHYWAKYRCKKVTFGKSFVNDGRTIFQWLGADGTEIKPSPHQLIFATRGNKGTDWFEVEQDMLVPTGAASIVVTPCLFRPKTGTLDIAETRLTTLDQASVDALAAVDAAVAAEKARVVAETASKKTDDDATVQKMLRLPSKSVVIKTSGNKLVAPDGSTVWLQGVNIPSMEWSATGEHILQSFKEALVDWKANVIRLPLNDDFWFGRPKGSPRDAPPAGDPAAQSEYRKLVDDAVTVAASQGAYVVLDLHRYVAPDDGALVFWTDVATRYANNPAVLFDIYNEPHSISWEVWRNGGDVSTKAKDKSTVVYHSSGMQSLVDAIRKTGAKNIVVAGGLEYAFDLGGVLKGFALKDDTGNGIVYATHFYNWHHGWQSHFLDVAEKYPVLVGETGADTKKMSFIPANSQEDPMTWAPDALGMIQKYKLNWTAFCMHPAATPRLIRAWNYEPTPFWGQFVRDALSGKQFESKSLR